jgi:hypothetical protein
MGLIRSAPRFLVYRVTARKLRDLFRLAVTYNVSGIHLNLSFSSAISFQQISLLPCLQRFYKTQVNHLSRALWRPLKNCRC